jgi:hypothetical protein
MEFYLLNDLRSDNMYRLPRSIALQLVVCWFLLAASLVAQPAETRGVSVLSDRYETLASTPSEFLAKVSTTIADEGKDEAKNDAAQPDASIVMALPFDLLLVAVNRLDRNAMTTLSKSYGVFIMGAKNFGKSEAGTQNALGLINSDDCYVGILTKGHQPELKTVFSKAKSQVIDDRTVWTWSIPTDADPTPTRFYAAQVADRFLVLSNNLSDFNSVSQALLAPDKANTTNLGVDASLANNSFWMARPISGANRSETVGLSGLSADVVSLTLTSDTSNWKSTLQVASNNTNPDAAPTIDSRSSQMRFISPGRWNLDIPPATNDEGTMKMLRVFALFGFATSI